MNAKTIGRIQLVFGIALLAVLTAGFIIGFRHFLISPMVSGAETVMSTWADVSGAANATEIGVTGHLVSSLTMMGLVVKASTAVFISTAVILLALSVMFILQGLANISRK